MIRTLSVEYGIKECCEGLRVSRSGYYQWKKAEPSQRERAEAELVEQIKGVFEANKGRYGSPRVRQALRQDGIECGENRVARLMRENELAARRKQAFRPRTTVPGKGTAPNLIKDLAPRRWLAARSSNTSKFITTIGVCIARLVIRHRASLKPAIVKEETTFSKEKCQLPFFRMRNVVQESKRNKWRVARRELPFMPACDLECSAAF